MNDERQAMAAIINSSQINSQAKAEQLLTLLLGDTPWYYQEPLADMLVEMMEKYVHDLCRYSSLPALTHPLMVLYQTGQYADEYGCLNSNILLAALGHDLLDDKKFTYPELIHRFGKETANIIFSLTDYNKQVDDDRHQPNFNIWHTRKALYLRSLQDRLGQTWSKPMLLIAGVDKLDNSDRITIEARQYGENVWKTPTKDLIWYYQAVAELIAKHLGGRLSDDLQKSCQIMVKALTRIKK